MRENFKWKSIKTKTHTNSDMSKCKIWRESKPSKLSKNHRKSAGSEKTQPSEEGF